MVMNSSLEGGGQVEKGKMSRVSLLLLMLRRAVGGRRLCIALHCPGGYCVYTTNYGMKTMIYDLID